MDFQWSILERLAGFPVMGQQICQVKTVIVVVVWDPGQHICQPLPWIYILCSTAADGETLKNYGHYFARDTVNNVYFTEAYYKNFPGHHLDTSTPLRVEEMFGHGTIADQTKP